MPFGLSELNFIDDAVNSVANGLDSLFSNKEERMKAEAEFKKLKNQLKIQTQKHTENMARIYTEGRAQARNVQQKSLNKAWWMMPLLSIFAFAGFFGILFSLVFGDVNLEAKQPLLIMLGTLGTIVTQIAHFLWGSSQGSKNKESQIMEMMRHQKSSGPSDHVGTPTPEPKDKPSRTKKTETNPIPKVEPAKPESNESRKKQAKPPKPPKPDKIGTITNRY